MGHTIPLPLWTEWTVSLHRVTANTRILVAHVCHVVSELGQGDTVGWLTHIPLAPGTLFPGWLITAPSSQTLQEWDALECWHSFNPSAPFSLNRDSCLTIYPIVFRQLSCNRLIQDFGKQSTMKIKVSSSVTHRSVALSWPWPVNPCGCKCKRRDFTLRNTIVMPWYSVCQLWEDEVDFRDILFLNRFILFDKVIHESSSKLHNICVCGCFDAIAYWSNNVRIITTDCSPNDFQKGKDENALLPALNNHCFQ